MIAKCIAVLAIVAQINASGCGCDNSFEVIPNGSNSHDSPIVLVSPGSSGSSSGPVTRNLVASGKYPVALKNCGPTPDQQIPVTTSRFTAPLQEKPTVRLPASIPAPKTISHSCTCYKTIVRPRVHQQIITVPSVQRYVETSHKPVIENIQYEAVPVNCGSGVKFIQLGDGSSNSALVELVSTDSGSSCCLPQVQNIEMPLIQTVQVPLGQALEARRVQVLQMPHAEPVPFGSCSCHY